MEEAFGQTRDRVAVTWLPLFHDMGLVAYVVMPLILGYPCHLMSPFAFLARPASWLSLITRVRGTTSAAPNFAYGLCARKISDEECRGLDLSSWRVACNGAEPVTPEVVAAFSRRFAPYGFDPAAMLPCYGLAEDTLCVASRRPGEGARVERVCREELERRGVVRPPREGEPAAVMVSVGRPLLNHEVLLLDPEGTPLPERRVGEIAVRSPSVMHGYLPGTEGEVALRPDGWLLTGDLGYLADGELFVVGRKKDLVIRGGRNYFPQDLEEAVSRVPGVRPGRAVALSVVDPAGECVVIAAECRQGWEGEAAALQESIRGAVFAAVRFLPDDVVLLPPHALPLTSSGKVMRPAARTLYLERWRRDP
jgi:acyl-CoA synthetase (AMP-forming)/AMP-acid ligase II